MGSAPDLGHNLYAIGSPTHPMTSPIRLAFIRRNIMACNCTFHSYTLLTTFRDACDDHYAQHAS